MEYKNGIFFVQQLESMFNFKYNFKISEMTPYKKNYIREEIKIFTQKPH